MSPRLALAEVETLSTPTFTPSPQQAAVLAAVADPAGGSLRVEAVAGAGKTTTLIEACRLMEGRVAFCAFNKRIADEIKARTQGMRHVRAGTLHSFGFAAWKQTAPSCDVSGEKLDGLCDDLDVPRPQQAFVRQMVSLAKQACRLHPVSEEDWTFMADWHDAWEKLPEFFSEDQQAGALVHANRVLKASIESAEETIDFDDMLYMPLMYGNIQAEFDWVCLDEAQDTNTARRMLAARLLKPSGRMLAVGDSHQAIYGFTGADADALDLISAEFSCKFMPLTITYRCPKKVVAHARQWVSHIEAAPTAPEGIVRDLDARAFEGLGPNAFTGADAVLCRNTRPLVSLALTLLRRGIGCRVEGREIGQQLVKLATRWKNVKTIPQLEDKLYEYRDVESRKLLARGRRAKAAALEDRVDSLVAFAQSLPAGASIYDLTTRVSTLFADSIPGQPARLCTLSTIHKAKGREWDRVYLLGRNALQPSRWAKQEWEIQQETNLIYVAVTRAKRELVEVEYVG